MTVGRGARGLPGGEPVVADVFSNLLENAVLYGRAGTEVRAEVTRGGLLAGAGGQSR